MRRFYKLPIKQEMQWQESLETFLSQIWRQSTHCQDKRAIIAKYSVPPADLSFLNQLFKYFPHSKVEQKKKSIYLRTHERCLANTDWKNKIMWDKINGMK